MTTTYHVKHRWGFIGESGLTLVAEVQHALIYSRDGAISTARDLNSRLTDDRDRRAQAVMLTSSGKVRIVHTSGASNSADATSTDRQ